MKCPIVSSRNPQQLGYISCRHFHSVKNKIYVKLYSLSVTANEFRRKMLNKFLGITYSADCFAYCVMAHLLWPTRSEQYFLLKGQSSADLEELDEFNEAPHIVNNSYTSMDSIGSLEICRYEDPQKNKLING